MQSPFPRKRDSEAGDRAAENTLLTCTGLRGDKNAGHEAR